MKKGFRRVARIAALVLITGALGSCAVVLGFIIPNTFDFEGFSEEIDEVLIYDFGEGPDGGTYVGLVLMSGSYSYDRSGNFVGSGDIVYVEVLAEDGDLTIWQSYDWENINEVGELVYASIWLGTQHDGSTTYFYDDYAEINGGNALVRRPLIGDIVVQLDANTPGGPLTATYRGPSLEMDSGALIPINPFPTTSVTGPTAESSRLPTLRAVEE